MTAPKYAKEAEALEAEAKEYERQARELAQKCSTTVPPKKRSECKKKVDSLRAQARLRRNLARAKTKI